jgi:hypothetical protein
VDVQGVRPPPAVCTVDVHGVFPPPAVWTFMRGVFPPQPAELEFLNNLWGLGSRHVWTCTHFSPHAVWTCRFYAVPPLYSVRKCQNARLSCIRAVRYRVTEWKKMQMPEPVGTERRGTSPVPEWFGTALTCQMPECRCQGHQPWCLCPAIIKREE